MAGQLGAIGGNLAQPIKTLAYRLEEAHHLIHGQCNRIEETLGRINGVPQTRSEEVPEKAPQAATAPLSQSVEAMEQHAKRLVELANTLEQVA